MADKGSTVLLDVMMEGLRDMLEFSGWRVETVTESLGADREKRDDARALEYARSKGAIVVTEDKRFIRRLEEEGVQFLTVSPADKAKVIDAKLREMFP